jgi:hypothetical protein
MPRGGSRDHCRRTVPAMNDAVNAKFGLFGLLKLLDRYQGGELHDELAAIARDLGLELPAVAPPPDPRVEHGAGSDGEAEAAGEVSESEQDRVLQFLATQPEPVSLAGIVAELNANRWTVNSTLHRLLKKGSVEHVGHDAWKIAAPLASPKRSEGGVEP